MRFDSFLREPWSTIITPSFSPTPFVCRPNPPFPVAKHPFVGKYLLFLRLLCNFTKLGSAHLGFVPMCLVEVLDCPKRKQIIVIHSSSNTLYKRVHCMKQNNNSFEHFRFWNRDFLWLNQDFLVYTDCLAGEKMQEMKRKEKKTCNTATDESAPTYCKIPKFRIFSYVFL